MMPFGAIKPRACLFETDSFAIEMMMMMISAADE